MADDSKHDMQSIQKIAKNAAERRLALESCLANYWTLPPEDIKRLERRDEANWNGWDMWRQ